MAEPVLSVMLLTPTSVRLSWTALSGNYEIWWRSNHPPNQEFGPLAVVTGGSYDVTGLNWTTIYEFKARRVSGATFYAFGDILKIFCQCGQGFIITTSPPNAPPTMWQQSVDVENGQVGVSAIYKLSQKIYMSASSLDGIVWDYYREIETEILYTDFMTTRYVSGGVFLSTPLSVYPAAYFGLDANEQLIGPKQWDGYHGETGLAVNSSGRVVILLQTFSASTIYSVVSMNWGNTFTEPLLLLSDIYLEGQVVYEEALDGTIWFSVGYVHLTPSFHRTIRIYKYIVGSGISLIHETGTDVKEAANLGYFGMAAEESIIAVSFLDNIAGVVYKKVVISIDGGVNWATKDIDTAKVGSSYVSPVTLSNGALIVFTRNSAGPYYGLHRSTDNGDTWELVYPIDTGTVYSMPWLAYGVLRSDGQVAVFTNCEMALLPAADHSLGYLKSMDAGATWDWVDMPYAYEAVVPM